MYALPAAFLGAVAASRLHPENRVAAFRLALGWILLSIVFWFALLRGMVAVGGLIAAWGAMALCFDRPLARWGWKRTCALALLLLALCLYRRFFLFWVIAFFPAALLAECLRESDWRGRLLAIRTLVATGLLSAAGFCLLAWPQVEYMFAADVGGTFKIYRQHDNPLMYIVEWAKFTGFLSFAAMAAGMVIGLRSERLRAPTVFLAMHFLLVVVLFGSIQMFEKHHFLLLYSTAMPLAVIALVSLWRRARVAGRVLLALLAFSSALATIPPLARALPFLSPALSGWQATPLVRPDFDELGRLMAALDALPGAADEETGVYILSSSDVLSDEIARAFRRLSPARPQAARLRATAHKDAPRFGFPSELLRARYVVLADPLQRHLNSPNAQIVLRVPYELIRSGEGFGAAFTSLPETFRLDRDVTVRLYERRAPFTSAQVESLREAFMTAAGLPDANEYSFPPPPEAPAP